jgi:2-polyprenyl-3-methyl-5-hydroxy-6-metoxy-1,4-benzoquinol methylase
MNQFTEDYYEHGKEKHLSLYEHYRWLPELTIPMAERIVATCGIEKTDQILDFGCAKGYLVKALRQLGYLAWGTDISEYALSQADKETDPYLFGPKTMEVCSTPMGSGRFFQWVICKDVLEHIEEHDLAKTLAGLRRTTANIFIAVPLGNNGAYTIPDMELDVTHRIRRPLWWWTAQIEAAGFNQKVESTFSMRGIKENWTRKWPFGNGFIIAK